MKLPTAEDVIDGERDILSIARQIREYRKSKGITRAHLARMMGKHPSHIRRIEDGEFTKFETLQEYAKTLGLNMLITLVEE